MGTINLVEALKNKEIKDARMQGTDVLSIKLPTNELFHVKLKSLVAEFEGDDPRKKSAKKTTSKEDKRAAKKKR